MGCMPCIVYPKLLLKVSIAAADKNIKMDCQYCCKIALEVTSEKKNRALYILRTSII